jgi:hypothetical protein
MLVHRPILPSVDRFSSTLRGATLEEVALNSKMQRTWRIVARLEALLTSSWLYPLAPQQCIDLALVSLKFIFKLSFHVDSKQLRDQSANYIEPHELPREGKGYHVIDSLLTIKQLILSELQAQVRRK